MNKTKVLLIVLLGIVVIIIGVMIGLSFSAPVTISFWAGSLFTVGVGKILEGIKTL